MDCYAYQNFTTKNCGNAINQQNHFHNYNEASTSLQALVPHSNYILYNHHRNVMTNPGKYDLSLPMYEIPEDQKSDDELWVETWLSKIGKIQINLNATIEIKQLKENKHRPKSFKNYIQIHTAKTALSNCLGVLKKLQSMEEYLQNNANDMSSVEWTKKTSEIGVLKNEFSSLLSPFENSDTLEVLKKNVAKRKKKRVNKKQGKQQQKLLLKETLEKRKIINKKIDEWLENMKEEAERAKMEENMKKDADCVLAEVLKKKTDARRQLSLISALLKLRNVREMAATQKGEENSLEDSSAFSKITDRLSKMWKDSLNIYGKEEQGLRLMLEQNAFKTKEVTYDHKRNKVTDDWIKTLFGPKFIPSAAYWGLTSAEKSLESFIAIRKSWDTFLSKPYDDSGSKIPVGWVLPNQNPQYDWKTFLDKNI